MGMATELTEIRLQDGRILFAEVEETRGGGPTAVAIGDVDFHKALSSIKGAAEELFDTLHSMTVSPDSCEISFGIKLSGSIGAVLAKAEGEANFAVKMTWSDLKA
jgi:hypothetical protein